MEYKLSSFEFSDKFSRDQKHFVIQRINSFRSKCPSDATFSGTFSLDNDQFSGSIKVLFSKGEFLAESQNTTCEELMKAIEASIWTQIEDWRANRFKDEEYKKSS